MIIETDLEQVEDITAGTAAASKALVVDANKDIKTLRNITIHLHFLLLLIHLIIIL